MKKKIQIFQNNNSFDDVEEYNQNGLVTLTTQPDPETPGPKSTKT